MCGVGSHSKSKWSSEEGFQDDLSFICSAASAFSTFTNLELIPYVTQHLMSLSPEFCKDFKHFDGIFSLVINVLPVSFAENNGPILLQCCFTSL